MEKEFSKAEQRLEAIRNYSRWIQIDVCDGILVSGKTFELELLNSISFGENKLWDIHLMVKEPINWIEKCVFVGACRIIGQVEMMTDRKMFVEKVKNAGLEVGLAFDANTKVSDIPEETDMILLMGRKMGFEQAELRENIYQEIVNNQGNKPIAVDGGVNLDNIHRLIEIGTDIIYSGKAYKDIYDQH